MPISSAARNRMPSYTAPQKQLPPKARAPQKQPVPNKAAPQRALPPPAPLDSEDYEEEEDDEDDEDESESDNEGYSDEKALSRARGSGNTLLVKVISLAVAEGANQLSEMPITSLELPIENRSEFWTDTKLSDIRKRLDGVLREGQAFTFCSDDCAVVPSEEISLEAYLKTLQRYTSQETGTLRVYIAATKESSVSQASVLLSPPFLLKFIQMGESSSDALNTGSLHSSAFQKKDPSHLPMGELRRMIGKMSSSPKMHVFCGLDGSAAGDELTLSQYLDIDKEGVHEKEGTPSIIIRFRKTEAKVSAAASKFHGASREVLAAMERMKFDPTMKDHRAEEFKVDKSGFRVQEELDASRIAAHDASPLKYTSQMDEADWDAVLRNCCLLYGWKINKKTNRMERATTPAFRLRNKNPIPVPAVLPSQPEPPAAPAKEQTEGSKPAAIEASSSNASSTGAGGSNADTPGTTEDGSAAADSGSGLIPAEPPVLKALTAEDIAGGIPVKLGAIPSYAINDRSRIQITTVSSEFQESMAKNHFDSTSVEASVSGGYAGFSAGVTGGFATESSSKQVNTKKTFSKRMIGSYMFPRVSVFLRPEDLEPTQELRQALDTVRSTKEINNLRKLYATFGHLFCQSVTLGGCLQTTKIVTGNQDTEDTEEREAFKASVGVAFSTPFGVGGSAKASHETSDSAATFRQQTNTSEAMAFEATGGNSILAADPPAWSSSVADFNNWRVIDQTELTPIVDTMAGMLGYAEVKTWFLSAVPKLSQYVVIPESRTIHVRFKVANQGNSFEHITGRSEQAYLGLDPSRPPKPIRTSLERRAPEVAIHSEIRWNFIFPSVDMTVTTRQVDVHKMDAMFYPHSTQAPVLMFPLGKEVGTQWDKSLLQTVWRLEVAQGYSLGSDSLVCIKSCAPVRSGPDREPTQAELGLAVYRNAQGVFMPTITSSDEPCYWRLQRVASDGLKQDRFRHGEVFRLTWSFADQASGYRDYRDDTFGRRSFQRPADFPHEKLCLKMPYPRFENTGDNAGISLVLSPAMTTDPIVQPFNVRATPDEGGGADRVVNYNLHDLSFRLDYVTNDGAGDSGDFMNVVTEAHEERRVEHTWSGEGVNPYSLLPIGSPEAMLAGVLLGPAAAPIAGIGSILGGIIGF